MAALNSDKHGWFVQFNDRNRRRRTIRLGTGVTKKQAERIKLKIEDLVTAAQSGDRLSVSDDTAKWIDADGDTLASKLAKAGLIPERAATRANETTLDEFCKAYIASRMVPSREGQRSYSQRESDSSKCARGSWRSSRPGGAWPR